MRVLFLQRQPCIRTLKYAIGLRAARPELRLDFACQGQTLSGWYGSGDEMFDGWWPLDADPAGMRESLRLVLDEVQPDLIHSHNLPDGLTAAALDLTDAPVIHDSHDMQSLRHTPYEDGFPELDDPLVLERRAVEGSAGLITVSDEMLAQIRSRYRVPAHSLVFANYAPQRDLPTVLPPPRRTRSGSFRVVYQGTLSTNGGHYDLRHLFCGLVTQGVELDIYPSRPSPDYIDLAAATPGMRCHESLEPSKLLQVLAEYDFGWAGFNDGLNGAHLDTVLPNKLFEYLGCGLPVLTLRHRALERFVTQHGAGLVLDSVEDLGRRLADLDVPALRARVGHIRSRFTIEANIGDVLALYDQVTASPR
jgi:glycosyltransferase involved in cell wall biosynthesis